MEQDEGKVEVMNEVQLKVEWCNRQEVEYNRMELNGTGIDRMVEMKMSSVHSPELGNGQLSKKKKQNRITK